MLDLQACISMHYASGVTLLTAITYIHGRESSGLQKTISFYESTEDLFTLFKASQPGVQ